MNKVRRFPSLLLLLILQACGGGDGDNTPPPGDDTAASYNRIWTYSTADPITSAPAIGDDGTIYFVTDFRELHAVNPDGTGQWVFAPGGIGRLEGPAIDSAGNLILSGLGRAYSVSPYGTLRWDQGCGIGTAVAIRADDAVVVAGGVGENSIAVCIFGPDGIPQQRFEHEAGIYSVSAHSITIAENGDMIVTWLGNSASDLDSTGMVAIAADGTKLFEGPGLGGPAVGADGTLYLGEADIIDQTDIPASGGLWAFLSDGTVAWNVTDAGRAYHSPVIGTDNTIYFTMTHPDDWLYRKGGQLFAVTDDGAVRWSIESTDESTPEGLDNRFYDWSDVLVGADGMLYTVRTGRLNVIKPDGTVEHISSDDTYSSDLWWSRTSLALSDDGVLYVISATGLDAIQTNSKGLAASSWPKAGGGRKNAYRYGAP